jgi:hypothetical protein
MGKSKAVSSHRTPKKRGSGLDSAPAMAKDSPGIREALKAISNAKNLPFLRAFAAWRETFP